jgi:hypothetical protein
MPRLRRRLSIPIDNGAKVRRESSLSITLLNRSKNGPWCHVCGSACRRGSTRKHRSGSLCRCLHRMHGGWKRPAPWSGSGVTPLLPGTRFPGVGEERVMRSIGVVLALTALALVGLIAIPTHGCADEQIRITGEAREVMFDGSQLQIIPTEKGVFIAMAGAAPVAPHHRGHHGTDRIHEHNASTVQCRGPSGGREVWLACANTGPAYQLVDLLRGMKRSL